MIDPKVHESLRKRFNPDGSELRKLQLRTVRMLEYFDKFCKENDITYWLGSGSCLGAIRHHGFIPWDDDLDIEMMSDDYKKLLSLREKFENDQNCIQDFITDKEYIAPHGKIRDKQSELKEVHNKDKYYKYKGAYIDIFVREQGSYLATKISHIIQFGLFWLSNIENPTLRTFIKTNSYKIIHSIIFPCLRYYNKLFGDKDILRHTLGCSSYYKTINKKGLFPLKFVDFEGKKYPVPGNYEDYLERLYGNYESLPSDLNHLRTHLQKIMLY